MKARQCKSPFDNYHGYKQVHSNGRTYVYLWNRKTDKRKLISLARYRMSVKLGRFLSRHEHVDHKDEDKTNDRIKNLQILTPAQNNRKTVALNGRAQRQVTLRCPICKIKFCRLEHRVKTKIARGHKPTCSRSCGAKYGHSSAPR